MLLGKGRYGEVYQVVNEGKLFASKVVHKNLLPGYPNVSSYRLSQMMKEINTLIKSLTHPNIEHYEAAVHSPDGSISLLSELSLKNLDNCILGWHGKVPLQLQIDYCHGMAKGLEFLHSVGIVHKNLHGRNVLVTKNFQAKIADYVCSQLPALNSIDTVDATLYPAPELKSDKPSYTFSSDIFSLGALYFQTVTGKVPNITDLHATDRRIVFLKSLPSSHPLTVLIYQCLSVHETIRPAINDVRNQVTEVKSSPQYAMLIHPKQVSITKRI